MYYSGRIMRRCNNRYARVGRAGLFASPFGHPLQSCSFAGSTERAERSRPLEVIAANGHIQPHGRSERAADERSEAERFRRANDWGSEGSRCCRAERSGAIQRRPKRGSRETYKNPSEDLFHLGSLPHSSKYTK